MNLARAGVDGAAGTAGEWELSEGEESSCGRAEPCKGQDSSGGRRQQVKKKNKNTLAQEKNGDKVAKVAVNCGVPIN